MSESTETRLAVIERDIREMNRMLEKISDTLPEKYNEVNERFDELEKRIAGTEQAKANINFLIMVLVAVGSAATAFISSLDKLKGFMK